MSRIKKVVASALILLAIIITSSVQIASGYIAEVNAIETVNTVLTGDSFSITSGAIIKLADISCAENCNFTLCHIQNGSQPEINIEGKEIRLDFDKESERNSSYTFLAVAYIQIDDSHFLNLNEYLLQHSETVVNNSINDFNPYTWFERIETNSVADNSRIDSQNFETVRLSLLSSYNSQTLTHATLLLTTLAAIVTSIIALFYKEKNSITFKINYNACQLLFFAMISMLFYLVSRLFFWSGMATSVLGILPSQAIGTNMPTVNLGIQSYLVDFYKHPPDYVFSPFNLLLNIDAVGTFLLLSPIAIALSDIILYFTLPETVRLKNFKRDLLFWMFPIFTVLLVVFSCLSLDLIKNLSINQTYCFIGLIMVDYGLLTGWLFYKYRIKDPNKSAKKWGPFYPP